MNDRAYLNKRKTSRRLFLYQILILLSLPFWMLLDIRRGAGRRELAMRFGFYDDRVGSGSYDLWLHAASVGEANAALTLLSKLYPTRKKSRILLSLGTRSAYEYITSRVSPDFDAILLPYDFASSLSRFLGRFSVSTLIIMENDFWPLLLRDVSRKGMRILAVSSSLSKSSMIRRRILAFFSYPFWEDLSSLAVQTPSDAKRFMHLGVDPARIFVCGNIKLDMFPAKKHQAQGEKLRRHIGSHRPVWIAASVHPGEISTLLDAHRQLLTLKPDSVLILAPRHMSRVRFIQKVINRKGFSYCLLSSVSKNLGVAQQPDYQILLVNTTGDMLALYVASDVAFVGGSLISKGGHNPIEPAILGRPVLMGANAGKSAQVANLLQQGGALIRIVHPENLASILARLMLGPQTDLRRLGRVAQDIIRGRQGVYLHIKEILSRWGICFR